MGVVSVVFDDAYPATRTTLWKRHSNDTTRELFFPPSLSFACLPALPVCASRIDRLLVDAEVHLHDGLPLPGHARIDPRPVVAPVTERGQFSKRRGRHKPSIFFGVGRLREDRVGWLHGMTLTGRRHVQKRRCTDGRGRGRDRQADGPFFFFLSFFFSLILCNNYAKVVCLRGGPCLLSVEDV